MPIYQSSLRYDGITVLRRNELDTFVRTATTGEVKLLVQKPPDQNCQHSEGVIAVAAFCEIAGQEPHWHGDAREAFVVLMGKLRIAWARPGKADAAVNVETLLEGDTAIVDRGCCHMVGVSKQGLALTFKAPPDLIVSKAGGVGKAGRRRQKQRVRAIN